MQSWKWESCHRYTIDSDTAQSIITNEPPALILVAVYFVIRMVENAEAALEREFDRSENLLLNVMPTSIALRLKEKPNAIIADHCKKPEIAVLVKMKNAGSNICRLVSTLQHETQPGENGHDFLSRTPRCLC